MSFYNFLLNKKLYLFFVCASLICASVLSSHIYKNIKNIYISIKTGEAQNTSPPPLYGFLSINTTDSSIHRKTFAADFSNFYYTGKNFHQNDIYKTTHDPLNRTSLYPPIFYYMFHKFFCQFIYVDAFFLHLCFQMTLLILSTFFILHYYRLALLTIPITLVYCVLLFLTPVGLSWLERGQCDIYSALAILWFIFAIYESKNYAFMIAALFASLKWTMMPFFFQSIIIYLILSKNAQKFSFIFFFILTITLTVLVFPQYIIPYLYNLFNTQTSSYTQGITLMAIMPHKFVLLIFIFILLIYLIPFIFFKKREETFLKTFLPYTSTLAILDVLIPAYSWEYRIVCLLGFMPTIVIWILRWEKNMIMRITYPLIFIIFTIICFHMFGINLELNHMIAAYFIYYLLVGLLLTCRIFLKNA